MSSDDQINMQELLQQAQQMQEQLMNAQAQLEDARVEGTAGGGLVTATVSGTGELVSLAIDPQAIDQGDAAETAETLADLVVASIRDANESASELQQQQMGPLSGGLGGDAGPQLPGY